VSVKTSTFYRSSQSSGTRHSPAADLIRALHPLPKAAARERKRKAEAAEILTSSPYKKMLMDKAKTKTVKTDSRKAKKAPKQKVRKDKARGRKPKAKTAKSAKKACTSRPVKSKKSKQSAAQDSDEDMTCCAGCGEHFCDSTEDWLQCRGCGLWFEVTCAGLIGKSKVIQQQFVCEQCVQ